MGLEIQGKSCTGAQRPAQTDPIFESSQYAQGSKVDLDYFYDAAAATSPLIVASPTKQALVMQKTRSRNVVNGDKYYFAGKQHYDTTHRDTFVANANEDGDFGELSPCPIFFFLFLWCTRARMRAVSRPLARSPARCFSLSFIPRSHSLCLRLRPNATTHAQMTTRGCWRWTARATGILQ
jgi:hypothetical protein